MQNGAKVNGSDQGNSLSLDDILAVVRIIEMTLKMIIINVLKLKYF